MNHSTLTAQQAEALAAFMRKQKPGAQCVISAPQLGMDLRQFDQLAKDWIANGHALFSPVGVPFRKVVNGEFLIQRITVIKEQQTDQADPFDD